MADFSNFTSGIKDNLTPDGGILNRKIDFQREKFLKGISSTKHGKKEDPTYIYFKFIFDFGDSSDIDPTTFLAPSPLFRSFNSSNESGDYEDQVEKIKQRAYSDAKSNNSDSFSEQKNTPTQDVDKVAETKTGSFGTDADFFYTAKSKIDGSQGSLFFPINGGIAYMGAQKFLYQRSKKRQQMLEAFKKGINFINRECPYYFQSLSGLDSLLKVDIKNYHKAASGPKRTGTLTIDCLEAIDMRMFSLAELYRKAVYDYTYHRTMLPENLRKFRMWIVITELRNIQLTYGVNDLLNPFSLPGVSQTANFVDSFNSQTGLLNNVQGIYDKSTKKDATAETVGSYNMGPYCFIYQLDQCEFDFDNTFPSYTSIDNKGSNTPVSSSFKIHVGRVKDYKIQFNQLADVIKKDNNIQQMVLSDVWGSGNGGYNDYDYYETQGIENATYSDKANPGEYFSKLASNFVMNTVGDLKNQGVSVVQGALLGNIYGFGGVNPQQAASNVQSLVSTIKGGVPNPFAKNDPQSKGFGGPTERQYPSINSDVYPTVGGTNGGSLGNVLPGGGPTETLKTDVYANNPGSDLGLPDRQYPVNNSDEYPNVPGSEAGVPGRVYPVPGGDQYTNTPGSDLGVPDRQYPVNNSDEYPNVPGSDAGVPGRVYPVPGGDQYANTPGSDLGVPDRQYPAPGGDEYPNVPGSDTGVPVRVYPVPGGDQYGNTPGSDLGVPDRQYPAPGGDEYPNVPGSDAGVPGRVYPVPGGDQYGNTPGSDLGLPDRQYPAPGGDEYPNVPGSDLGVSDRVYKEPGGDQYKNTPGPDLGLPDRQYPSSNGDEYKNVPGSDLGPISRVYPSPNEDKYQNTPGPDLGLPSRQYPNANMDEYPNVPGSDLGPKGRNYNTINQDLYSNTPGTDLGPPDRKYPSNNLDEYGSSNPLPNINLGRIYKSDK